jgi:hypothetical protein
VLALVLDRLSVRRARTVTVERERIEREQVEGDVEPEALPPAD